MAFSLPSTRLGWYSVGLAATFVGFLIFGVGVLETLMVEVPWEGVVMPLYSITALLCALGGGVAALIAVIRRHERSWLVWLAMVPGLAALVFLVGEFLHQW